MKCALNDPVFKFKIYSVELQDLNTNTNPTGLLLVFDFGSDQVLTMNFCEYLQVFETFLFVNKKFSFKNFCNKS